MEEARFNKKSLEEKLPGLRHELEALKAQEGVAKMKQAELDTKTLERNAKSKEPLGVDPNLPWTSLIDAQQVLPALAIFVILWLVRLQF